MSISDEISCDDLSDKSEDCIAISVTFDNGSRAMTARETCEKVYCSFRVFVLLTFSFLSLLWLC